MRRDEESEGKIICGQKRFNKTTKMLPCSVARLQDRLKNDAK